MDKKSELEQHLSEALSEGELKADDPGETAVKRLSAKYEIRIQAAKDPVREETERYRQMASEVDDRYEKRRGRQGNEE
ncbi:hypothetical protein [Paenibacillus sp. MBLB4367]|uniref:hypothetical protein n=1 Tax=Paenibacillus sp. MBLB4367 TaxID=3384767 RepID=UPI003908077D